MKYLSDSRFDFRGKNPYEFIKNIDKVGFIQIFLHPLHYSENGDTNYVQNFKTFS